MIGRIVLAMVLACAPLAATAAGQDDLVAMMKALGGGGLEGEALDRAIVEADKTPLGSATNPVRVNGPVKQHEYLRRLRCADGAAPLFQRSGNVGTGVFGQIVDLYIVNCRSGEPARVYLDMYHPKHVETRAVPGFTIENAATM